ncbi:MAG: alpha/beta hydrolase, partial [Candidatus Omnitrophica bacterium]|nr:alpha/beta hydrolase [Candidatus Omnitrophota bacterium]
GIAIAAVNYRLSPKAHYPAYINDAAAGAAWILRHIEDYQGSPEKLFVSGHSAGGYLTAMIGVDPQYLAKYGASVHDFAGFMPVSGQMVTHSTVRGERGIPSTQPLIDEAAPCYHVRKDLPPFLNISGSVDLPSRAEENRYFATAMNAAGHAWAEYREFIGRDHGTIVSRIPQGNDPVAEIMLDFMRRVMEKQP